MADKSPEDLRQEQLEDQRELEEKQAKERDELRRKNETSEQRQAREGQEQAEKDQQQKFDELLQPLKADKSGTWVSYGSVGNYAPGQELEMGEHSDEELAHWQAIGSIVRKEDHPYYVDRSDEPGFLTQAGMGVGPAIVDPVPPRPASESVPGHQVVVNPSDVVNPMGRVTTTPSQRVGEEAQLGSSDIGRNPVNAPKPALTQEQLQERDQANEPRQGQQPKSSSISESKPDKPSSAGQTNPSSGSKGSNKS